MKTLMNSEIQQVHGGTTASVDSIHYDVNYFGEPSLTLNVSLEEFYKSRYYSHFDDPDFKIVLNIREEGWISPVTNDDYLKVVIYPADFI